MAAKVKPIESDKPGDDSLSLPDILGLERRTTIPKTNKNTKEKQEYYDDTVRWPIWKTALLVIGLCGAFWTGVGYIVLRALG